MVLDLHRARIEDGGICNVLGSWYESQEYTESCSTYIGVLRRCIVFLRRTQATQAQGSCVVDLIISLYLEKSNWKDFFQNCNLNEGFVFVSDRGGNAYEFSMRQSDEHGRGNEKTKDFATRC